MMGDTTTTYPGKVEFPTATEGPFYGIVYGVPMTVTIVYDASVVPPTGVYEYLTYVGGKGNTILAAGNLTFGADMDNSNTMGWPVIQFNDGQFAGISYFCSFTEEGTAYQFSVNGLYWEIINAATNEDVASGTISTQPS